MTETRVFKSYDYLTGDVENVFSYDVPRPVYRRTRPFVQPGQWVREKAAPADTAREAVRRRIPVLAALGYIAAAALMVALLLSHIRLTALSDSAAQLEARIEQLDAEQEKLTVQYETVFNLAQIEEYATEQLNMQKPRDDQVGYLSGVSGQDRAEVIAPQRQPSLGAFFEGLAGSLLEYFR